MFFNIFSKHQISSTWHSTPASPKSILFICRWNISGALEIPNGSLLKQKHPKGVIKVVSSLDSSASGICQNPLLASSLLNTVAPDSCAKVVSTFGIGCTSHKTLSFRGFKSTQIRTIPESLGTITIAAHHGVGSSTGEMTPKFSIRCSSACTLALLLEVLTSCFSSP